MALDMNCPIIGLDLAKRVFQLHWVKLEAFKIFRKNCCDNKWQNYSVTARPVSSPWKRAAALITWA